MAYKMPSGKYRASRIINGVRKTKVFSTKREARDWEAEQDESVWQQELKPILTALQAANLYLVEVKSRMVRQTFVEKQTVFRLFFKAVRPNMPVEQIKVKDAGRFLAQQNLTRGGNAANGDRKNLVAWWNWLVESQIIGEDLVNPFSRVRKFPENRKARRVPSIEEMQSVLDLADGEVRLFLFTLLHTAARVGELFRMTWQDLDFGRKTVRLWTRKRKGGNLEPNFIPMTDELHEDLTELKRTARSVFVFCRADGQPFKQRIHLMGRLCKRAKVEAFGFHGIRHLSASMLDDAGKPLAQIQAMLRHKNATTTSLYLHSLRGQKGDVGDAFGQVKKKSPGRQPGGLILKAIGT